MVHVLLSFVMIALAASTAFAQAVNPARTYEQQRNSQSPADGVWHVFDKNGNLLKEENYKNYRLHGDIKTFTAEGSLKSVIPYNDGSRHGLGKTYYPSGALQGEYNYSDNNLNGISKEYYETGELKRAADYKDGQLNGTTKIYYTNGALKQQWTYKKGIVHGVETLYDEGGHVTQENNFQNGVLVASKNYSKGEGVMTAGVKPVMVNPDAPATPAAAVAETKTPPPTDNNRKY